MRRHRRALIVVAMTVVCGSLEGDRNSRGEELRTWAFQNRSVFMEKYFRESADLRVGERVSVLMFGDYQCETRLTIGKKEDEILVEVLVALGRDVEEQLALLRAKPDSSDKESVFRRVNISRYLFTSQEIPVLSKFWEELMALRLPVLPETGLMSPAVWFDVTAVADSEQQFSFPMPVTNSPATSYIHRPAAAAAERGDCGLVSSKD